MGITDKMWDAITAVIRMNDNVARLARTVKAQQVKIENLTERVIRLETALEMALAAQGIKRPPVRQIRTERVSVERSLPLVCQQWLKSRPAHHSEVFDYCRHLAQEGALFTGELGPLQ